MVSALNTSVQNEKCIVLQVRSVFVSRGILRALEQIRAASALRRDFANVEVSSGRVRLGWDFTYRFGSSGFYGRGGKFGILRTTRDFTKIQKGAIRI